MVSLAPIGAGALATDGAGRSGSGIVGGAATGTPPPEFLASVGSNPLLRSSASTKAIATITNVCVIAVGVVDLEISDGFLHHRQSD